MILHFTQYLDIFFLIFHIKTLVVISCYYIVYNLFFTCWQPGRSLPWEGGGLYDCVFVSILYKIFYYYILRLQQIH